MIFPSVSPVRPVQAPWLHLLGTVGVGERDAAGISWVQVGDAARYPPMPRTASPTTNNGPAPNVSGAKAEKP